MTNNEMNITIRFKKKEKPIYDAFHEHMEKNYDKYRGNVCHAGIDMVREWLEMKQGKSILDGHGK